MSSKPQDWQCVADGKLYVMVPKDDWERAGAKRDEGIAQGYLSACEQENRELRAEIERLRAAVETAAAMVRNADPDLADALLRRLGS